MRCPDSTRARLARAAAGGAALSEYSESELWEYIESLWRHRSPSKPGFRARELMTGARGDFDPARAANVAAAVLTAAGVALEESGHLTPDDLAQFVRLIT